MVAGEDVMALRGSYAAHVTWLDAIDMGRGS